MSEFYLLVSCEERSWLGPRLFGFDNKESLLEHLEEFFGRGEEISVFRVGESGEWQNVKEYDDFVSLIEERDLFEDVADKDSLMRVRRAKKLFLDLKKKLPEISGRSQKHVLFGCDYCSVTVEKSGKCQDEECICKHSCGCDRLREISFL
ncbi:hypothetical protein PMV_402 [Port-miou virus]|uniref:Uncharacterized protein n=1 Tax=Port-miou virus TaxID=1733873 RepID=A0A0N9Q1C8_9VIRU|nr:hypothetical protein PMV_402 [Port-miou virus]